MRWDCRSVRQAMQPAMNRGLFARQLAGDDFASLLVDTQMELAIVPAIWCSAQLAGVGSETAAVDQDVQRGSVPIPVEIRMA